MRLTRSRFSPRIGEEQSIITPRSAASREEKGRREQRRFRKEWGHSCPPVPERSGGRKTPTPIRRETFRSVDLVTAVYIPPIRRHITHSVISRAARRRKFTGMSHNSRVWGTEAWDST